MNSRASGGTEAGYSIFFLSTCVRLKSYVDDLLHYHVSLLALEGHAAGQQFVGEHSDTPNIH